MQIRIIAVGKIKEKYWKDALAEYAKRLSSYAKVELIEVADKSANEIGEKRALDLEAKLIEAHIPEGAQLIALDISGKALSSEQFAKKLEDFGNQSQSKLCVLIGGSYGLDKTLLGRAHFRLSFGPITLPHNLARVVFFEQLYRAFRIMKGEPYHK